MNYQQIHDSIIERARGQQRKKNAGVYYELHHILPKCMGGTENMTNKVLLTGKEHYIVHRLLHKIFPNNYKLSLAYWYMLRGGYDKRHFIPSAIAYNEAREAMSKAAREAKKKHNPHAYKVGHINTNETNLKISLAKLKHNPGAFKRGHSNKGTTGTRFIYSDFFRKSIRIKNEELQLFLDDGWKLGRKYWSTNKIKESIKTKWEDPQWKEKRLMAYKASGKVISDAKRKSWVDNNRCFIPIVLSAKIDFNKRGWIKKLSDILRNSPDSNKSWSHKDVKIFMERLMPDFYEKCFK